MKNNMIHKDDNKQKKIKQTKSVSINFLRIVNKSKKQKKITQLVKLVFLLNVFLLNALKIWLFGSPMSTRYQIQAFQRFT